MDRESIKKKKEEEGAELAVLLKQVFDSTGLTRAEINRRIGSDTSAVWRWYAGKLRYMELATAFNVEKKLNLASAPISSYLIKREKKRAGYTPEEIEGPRSQKEAFKSQIELEPLKNIQHAYELKFKKLNMEEMTIVLNKG